MAHTAHNWTPGVMKQPSSGKNGLKDLLKKREEQQLTLLLDIITSEVTCCLLIQLQV